MFGKTPCGVLDLGLTKMKFKINDARKIGKNFDLQAVVVTTIRRDGAVDIVTWGENRKKCNVIGWWGQRMFEQNASTWPFRTIFGWGNKGIPKPFSEEEKNELDQTVLDFISNAETNEWKKTK